ncbi:hypothetical protein EVAR_80904_1 [Eumeta japonica]|uniref:Uncharacterized protein n=1 Tax=Eumeta variegata TaxID=151549 RepID=A0A4C1V1I1_EUMVA|nr:hypothetical protein EVAR_80904_1 [Eumeta japonica]
MLARGNDDAAFVKTWDAVDHGGSAVGSAPVTRPSGVVIMIHRGDVTLRVVINSCRRVGRLLSPPTHALSRRPARAGPYYGLL